jgi:hypothetical protein
MIREELALKEGLILSDRATLLKPKQGPRSFWKMTRPPDADGVKRRICRPCRAVSPGIDRGSRHESRRTLISIKVDRDEIVLVERQFRHERNPHEPIP